MRKEYEKRPVDTKVLRDSFRKGLERKMNKLMSEGYLPLGGISTHMNTHAKPVLGIDVQEYTQTMVKYADFEIWIKDTDEDRSAFTDEGAHQSLSAQRDNLKKSLIKDTQKIQKLKALVEKSSAQATSNKKSFFKNIRDSFNASLVTSRKKQVLELEEKVTANKPRFRELTQQIEGLDNRLASYYKANPSVTKEILLSSR